MGCPFPNRSLAGLRPPAHPRSTPWAQRHRGSAPPVARPLGDGGSPCPAAAACHPEELDRLVPASARRHLPGSPALFEPGSLRCPSEVFSRSRAKPVPLLNGGAGGWLQASPFQDWGRVVLAGEALSRPVLLPALDSQVGVGRSEVDSRLSSS